MEISQWLQITKCAQMSMNVGILKIWMLNSIERVAIWEMFTESSSKLT